MVSLVPYIGLVGLATANPQIARIESFGAGADLEQIRAKLFSPNFDDDEFNPHSLKLLQKLTPRVPAGRYLVQLGTPNSFGYLTMAHPDLWSQHLETYGRWLGEPR